MTFRRCMGGENERAIEEEQDDAKLPGFLGKRAG